MPKQSTAQLSALMTGNPQEDLVNRIQQRVEAWIADGYPGGSEHR